MSELDFVGLAGILLSRWEEFMPSWAPGGKLIGREYTAGSVRGGPGDSFRFNIEKGAWADFATGEKGGDMISLYAAIQGMKNGEAAKRLADLLNYNLSDAPYKQQVAPKVTVNYQIGNPPKDVEEPAMITSRYGKPTGAWCYRDEKGHQIFWEARYETMDGKTILPWSWDLNMEKWVQKGYPSPRPLYGLDLLRERKDAPVVVVEGPKCAQVAQELMGQVYVAVTWNGGSNAVSKTDWSALKGRKPLIWPDADEPGIKAAKQIAETVAPFCDQV